jgi:DNA (cytosine-5)-methyltransferase 1
MSNAALGACYERYVDRPLRAIDICTGAGGLALGTHLAGFRHEALYEIDDAACATLTENAAAFGIEGAVEPVDVKTTDFKRHAGVDLITAGVPCQPFSAAGKHLGHVDDRNLFPVVIRAVREAAPKVVLVENVYALMRPRFADFFEYVQRQLRSPEVTKKHRESWRSHLKRLRAYQLASGDGLTYRVHWRTLQAADFGVPQQRSRVVVVAVRADLDATWEFPSSDPTGATFSRDALIHSQWVTGEYWREHDLRRPVREPAWVRAWLKQHDATASGLALRWRTVRDAIADLSEPLPRGSDGDHVRQPGARRYVGHDGSPLDWPAKTIKAGVHGVAGGENMLRHANGAVRYFTVREAARLQTFPDDFSFAKRTWGSGLRQIGNAVPVRLAHALTSGLAGMLRRGQASSTPARRAA